MTTATWNPDQMEEQLVDLFYAIWKSVPFEHRKTARWVLPEYLRWTLAPGTVCDACGNPSAPPMFGKPSRWDNKTLTPYVELGETA